jgi:hypothetical protein
VPLLVLSLGLSACTDDDTELRNAEGEIVASGVESVYELQTGDCLDPDPELTGEVAELPLVPCAEPHTQEVYGSVELDEGPYPGPEAVQLQADAACLGELETSLGLTLADGLFVSYLLPTFAGWNREEAPDRRVVCVLVFPDRESATGSVVAGTFDLGPSAPAPTPSQGDD